MTELAQEKIFTVVRLATRAYGLLYLALALAFVVTVGRYYDGRTGFTMLELFGERFEGRRVPQLHDVRVYTHDGNGYDGQFYAQLAVAGNPFARDVRRALDSPAYRSRRILLPLLSHLAGLGRPARVLDVFALSNLLCWSILAFALARWWFPPGSLHDLVRWTGTLFGAGMIVSVTHSLTDGPALLAIAAGVRCVERRRPWLGAAILALAGLVRETSALCATVFAPWPPRDRRAWLRAAAAGALAVLPAVVWMGVLYAHFHGGGESRNVALPLVGLREKLIELKAQRAARGFDALLCGEVLAVLALTTQVVFIASRRSPDQPWWRIGAIFALLWSVLGVPVWQSAPSAAARVVLPLTLAFNVLAPRSPGGLALLLAGNLTIFSAPALLTVVPSEQTFLTENIRVDFGGAWYGPEHLDRDTWRWAEGPATLVLHNPNPRPFAVTLDFGLRSVGRRTVTVSTPLRQEAVALEPGSLSARRIGPVVVPPGDTVVTFTSKEPAAAAPGDARPLTFALVDLQGDVSPSSP